VETGISSRETHYFGGANSPATAKISCPIEQKMETVTFHYFYFYRNETGPV
jgi:hypothetical protein